MNIPIELSVVIQVSAFIVFLVILWKSNRMQFVNLDKSAQNNLQYLETKIDNNITVVKMEQEGIRKDIGNTNELVKGVLESFKNEIYPRLNSLERKSDKNCRGLSDFRDLCDERRKNSCK